MMAVIGKEQLLSESVFASTLGICRKQKTLTMSKAMLQNKIKNRRNNTSEVCASLLLMRRSGASLHGRWLASFGHL